MYKREKTHSKGPDVRGPRFISTFLHDVTLRCGKAGSAFTIKKLDAGVKFSTRAREVRELGLRSRTGEEDIVGLYIPMNHIQIVVEMSDCGS